MKRKSLIYTIVILISNFYLTGYLFADEAKKGEMEKIYETVIIDEGIDPKILTVEPRTTVTWVSYTHTQAEILFLDKKVTAAADCPSSFFIGKNDAYESVKMCRNCTASLCFRKKGKYDYIVKESRAFYLGEKEYLGTVWIR